MIDRGASTDSRQRRALAAIAARGDVGTLTEKGDLLASTGELSVRVPVGAPGQVLTADPDQDAGVRWAAAAADGEVDGGSAASVYQAGQVFDGGGASG